MVLIFGLGSYPTGSGTVAALWFARQSQKRQGEKVVITDSKTADQLHQPTLRKLKKYKNVELVLGRHRKSDIRSARLIVRNPGVPDSSEYIQLAHKLKKPITNDVGIFINELRKKYSSMEVPIIAITGTRGKSTATALTGEILRAHYGKDAVHVGGNIGVSPLKFLSKVRSGHIIVLELSSWLLRDLQNPSFHIALFTNFLKDHMNAYPSMAAYRKDKERIFLGQTYNDIAILNTNDEVVKKMVTLTTAEVIMFAKKKVKNMKLRGEHNHSNVAAAYEVGKQMGVSDAKMKKVIRNFAGVPDRLELIRTYKGREFYNDTTATTPDAAIAALRSFKKKVILIAGGNSKQLPLGELRKEIEKSVKHLFLLQPGNANDQFPEGTLTIDMKDAVQQAWEVSKKGDIILLSPGVTWLPHMNEFARGKQFVKLVKAL